MNLAKYRKVSGLSQSDVAKNVGVSVATISRWEKNSNSVTLDHLRGFYKALSYEARSMMKNDLTSYLRS